MARDITKTALELKPHQVIIRPLVTEKGIHKANRCNAYAFEISRRLGLSEVIISAAEAGLSSEDTAVSAMLAGLEDTRRELAAEKEKIEKAGGSALEV